MELNNINISLVIIIFLIIHLYLRQIQKHKKYNDEYKINERPAIC